MCNKSQRLSSSNGQTLNSRSRAGPDKIFFKYLVSWTKKCGFKQILAQEGRKISVIDK